MQQYIIYSSIPYNSSPATVNLLYFEHCYNDLKWNKYTLTHRLNACLAIIASSVVMTLIWMLKTIVGAERAEILVEWSSEWALQIVMEQEQNGG